MENILSELEDVNNTRALQRLKYEFNSENYDSDENSQDKEIIVDESMKEESGDMIKTEIDIEEMDFGQDIMIPHALSAPKVKKKESKSKKELEEEEREKMHSMGDEQRRCAPLNGHQKQLMVRFLAKHPNLQSGNFTQGFTKKIARQQWEKLAAMLNSVPNGAMKNWAQWRKTWQDQKKNAKTKITRMRRHARIPGGGGPSQEKLTEYEEVVAALIDQSVATGTNTEDEDNRRMIEDEELKIEPQTSPLPMEMNFALPMESVEDNVPITATLVAGPSQVKDYVPVPVTPKRVAEPMEEKNTTPSFVRRTTKSRRKSLSDELVQGVNRRSKNLVEYQKAKLQHFKRERLRRHKYEQQKLVLLRERNEMTQRAHEMINHNLVKLNENLVNINENLVNVVNNRG